MSNIDGVGGGGDDEYKCYNSFAQTCYVLDCFSSSSLSHIVSIMKCVHPIEQQT
jgi:hypothetical protein